MPHNGPPKDVDSVTLLAQLRERPRPSKVVDFPGVQYKGTSWERIRVIVQPSNANGQAQLAAHKRMRDEMRLPLEEWRTETGTAILGDLVAKEMLARMLYSEQEIAPGKYARFAADSKTIEELCSADEIAVLFELTQRVQLELGPRLQILTDAEVDTWIERLKGGFDPLAYLGQQDWEILLRGLHRRMVKYSEFCSQDSQASEWRRFLESSQMTFAMGTTSSGEPQLQPSNGTASSESFDEKLRRVGRRRKPTADDED